MAELGLDHLSASSIGTYMDCPRRWFYRTVQRITSPPSGALTQGKVLGKGVEVGYRQQMFLREVEGPEAMIDDGIIYDTISTEWSEQESEVDWSQETTTSGEALDQTIDGAHLYHREIMVVTNPISVERSIVVAHDRWAWPLLGYLDIEEETKVEDLKFTGKAKSQSDLNRDVQADIYQLGRDAEGKPADFQWQNVVKTKVPKLVILNREGYDQERAVRRIEMVQVAIHATLDAYYKSGNEDVFAGASPSWWGCSDKWCGYYSRCPYGAGGDRGVRVNG